MADTGLEGLYILTRLDTLDGVKNFVDSLTSPTSKEILLDAYNELIIIREYLNHWKSFDELLNDKKENTKNIWENCFVAPDPSSIHMPVVYKYAYVYDLYDQGEILELTTDVDVPAGYVPESSNPVNRNTVGRYIFSGDMQEIKDAFFTEWLKSELAKNVFSIYDQVYYGLGYSNDGKFSLCKKYSMNDLSSDVPKVLEYVREVCYRQVNDTRYISLVIDAIQAALEYQITSDTAFGKTITQLNYATPATLRRIYNSSQETIRVHSGNEIVAADDTYGFGPHISSIFRNTDFIKAAVYNNRENQALKLPNVDPLVPEEGKISMLDDIHDIVLKAMNISEAKLNIIYPGFVLHDSSTGREAPTALGADILNLCWKYGASTENSSKPVLSKMPRSFLGIVKMLTLAYTDDLSSEPCRAKLAEVSNLAEVCDELYTKFGIVVPNGCNATKIHNYLNTTLQISTESRSTQAPKPDVLKFAMINQRCAQSAAMRYRLQSRR